jgi:hypothetical protein
MMGYVVILNLFPSYFFGGYQNSPIVYFILLTTQHKLPSQE